VKQGSKNTLITQFNQPQNLVADFNGDGSSVTSLSPRILGGNAALAFDTCLRDDQTHNLFQFNSKTGDYLFTRCSDGFTLNGTGSVRIVNSIASLTDSRPDRRISAGFLIGQRTGRANITLILGGGIYQTYRVNSINPGTSCICTGQT
jgi:hypothetical protein